MTDLASKLYKTLESLDIIDAAQLTTIYTNTSDDGHSTFESELLANELIDKVNLGRIAADTYGYKYVNLSEVSIPDDVLKLVPETVAAKQQLVAFKRDSNGVHVAMNTPEQSTTIKLLQKKTGENIHLYYTTPQDIDQAIKGYMKDVKSVFSEIMNDSIAKAQNDDNAEPPIIDIVSNIIYYAYHNGASDVHIEPLEDETLVRFRIDGVLHDIVTLPKELHGQVVTRIKVLSGLRTDEHLAAQDGKALYETKEETLDLRVSIVPVTNGEKVVLRLLSEKSRRFSLSDLGLVGENLSRLQAAYKKPHGMILATGPTGSGKTTTLYSILKIVNKPDINIMTIEDPVEYDIERINQIQTNEKTDLTFAKGLRSIVRQDPDVILVGEIRDEETASIAVNAATTGHLVLSTLHTNDAATTFPRLIDMEVEPFLIASTINVVVSQRLVRKICSACRVGKQVKKSELADSIVGEVLDTYFPDETISVYEGKGCKVCHETGYRGRIGVFEVLSVDEDVRTAITEKKDASVIRSIALKNGMTSILEDGLEKVKQGLTTLDEVMRVVKE